MIILFRARCPSHVSNGCCQSYDKAFRGAYYRGHLSSAQWLYQLDDYYLVHEHDNAFYAACEGGQIDVTEWLHSLGVGPVNETSFSRHAVEVTYR
jgi:hypothetical protein